MATDNATLDAIAAAGTPTPAGDATFGTPTVLSPAAECSFQNVKYSQRVSLGALIKDATAVLYVRKSQLPAGVAPKKGNELKVTPVGSTQQVMVADHVIDWPSGGPLAHYEIFLRERKP